MNDCSTAQNKKQNGGQEMTSQAVDLRSEGKVRVLRVVTSLTSFYVRALMTFSVPVSRT